ncbi:MFS transporter [Shimia ponticola]|uniref:MFS transporter n=1 Tax=Shimia ponticola TaxID=2582893 RepID=UPI0011BE9AE7|nr:MFS transporter [Shimia ponticola]
MSERGSLIRDPRWRAVVAAFVLNGLLFGAWASRVPAFKEGFGLEPSVLGALLLALAGGAIVSFPFAGAISEKWGPERLTIWCSWGYAPALLLLAVAPTPVLLGLALFVFGAFHGAMDVAMNGWGAKVEEKLGRSTMSIFHAMFSLGAGLGAGTGYVAAGFAISPLPQFALVAIIGLVTALWVLYAAPIPKAEKPRAGEKAPFLALPTGSLFLVGLIAFSTSMGEGAMADWSAVFLRLASDVDEARAALGYAVFSVAMVLTRLMGGVLVERWGPVAVTRASAVVAFSGVMTSVFGASFGLSLAGFALMGVGYAVVMPLVFSRAANDPHVAPGPAIASVATLGYGGLLLGPPIIGFVAQATGMRLSFLVLAALALLALTLAGRLRSA